MAFVTRIKEYRAKLNMTQEDLAKSVGVRRETISHLEKVNTILLCSLLTILRGHFIVRLMRFLFLRMNKNTGILFTKNTGIFIYTTITHTKPHEICPIVNIDPQYNLIIYIHLDVIHIFLKTNIPICNYIAFRNNFPIPKVVL